MLVRKTEAPCPDRDRRAAVTAFLTLPRFGGFFGQDRLLPAAEWLIASLLIVFTFPLLVLVWLAIKLESAGPALERQPWLGRNGRRFVVLRFRTTLHDPQRASRPIWDRAARETRVGQFLRYTRIDDLPKLVNVIRGEMTLIGAGAERPVFPD